MQPAHEPAKRWELLGQAGNQKKAWGQLVVRSENLRRSSGQLVDNLLFPVKNAITLQPCNAPLIALPLSMLNCSHCHTDLYHGQSKRRIGRWGARASITGRSTSIVPERSARPSLQQNNLNEKSIMASCVPGKGPDATRRQRLCQAPACTVIHSDRRRVLPASRRRRREGGGSAV